MQYSDDQLRDIEKYASIYMPIRDIAVILGIPAEVLRFDIAQRDSLVSVAYYRGQAATKVQLHNATVTLARIGSPLALQQTQEYLLDMMDDE